MKSLGWLFLIVMMTCSSPAQSLEDGLALFNKGKLGEAKAVFEALLKQNENGAEAHYRLGLILLSRQFRNEDDAVDHMERAVEINAISADYQYGLGAALGTKAQNAGVFKQAFLAPRIRKAFEKAVELNPKLVEAHFGLAQYYWKAPGIMGGDMEKAWKEADAVIQLDEVRGRAFKAGILISEKKNNEAVQEIKTMTANKSNDWRAWRAAGSFYLQNQMTGDAVASFEKYAAMRPDTAQSFHLLAQGYLQKKDAEKALELAKKALSLDNNYGPAINVTAQAYELKGQKKEAREHYQRLLTMELSQDQRKNIEKKVNELQ
ncbi:MAG: tetratricopeptide repeat protein [Ignavibacteriales bacterium]|nr:tetratricopeptide repeat protein [Ignavibacteriales bacterium]